MENFIRLFLEGCVNNLVPFTVFRNSTCSSLETVRTNNYVPELTEFRRYSGYAD